jgi:molecular chaperone GrpE
MSEMRDARTATGEASPSGAGAPAEPDSPTGSVASSPTSSPASAGESGELAELRTRVAELDDRWRRALADFDNLRKRVSRESAQQREEERARVAAQWLPVLDNLELALQHAGSDSASIVTGVQAVLDQALGVLANLGYPRRADENEQFDPARHEAVAAVPDATAAPGTILQVVRPGYGSDDHPLRPAAVVVAKGA